MLESHLASDFCLIGPKGCGKSTTVRRLADLLGYQVEPIVLYQASLEYIILHESDFTLLFDLRVSFCKRRNLSSNLKKLSLASVIATVCSRNETVEIFS